METDLLGFYGFHVLMGFHAPFWPPFLDFQIFTFDQIFNRTFGYYLGILSGKRFLHNKSIQRKKLIFLDILMKSQGFEMQYLI